MNKNAKKFIEFIKKECKKYKVKVDIAPRKYLVIPEDGYCRCSGYFCPETKRVRAAAKQPFNQWFPTLVHEYAHFTQWRDESKHWVNCCIGSRNLDAGGELFEWINGSRRRRKTIEECVIKTRNLELECERRAYKLIKKFNLPINLDLYGQQASAYIHLYNWIKHSRSWVKIGNTPYTNKNVYSVMPTTLNGRYDRFPKKYLKLYNEELK